MLYSITNLAVKEIIKSFSKLVIRDELALYICTIKSELLTTSVIDVLIADRHCNIEVNKVFNIGGKNR